MYFWYNYHFRVGMYLDLVNCDNLSVMTYTRGGDIIQIGPVRAFELNYMHGL